MDRWLDGEFAAGLPGATLRATILLLAAWVLTQALRRSSAAVRHCVWSLALLGLIAIPLVLESGIEWRVPILPGSPTSTPTARSEPSPPTANSPVPVVVPLNITSGTSISHPPRKASVNDPNPYQSIIASSPAPITPAVARRWDFSQVIIAVWAVGCVGLLVHTLAGLVLGEVRRQRSRPLTDEPWSSSLNSARQAYAIRRRVELRCGEGSPVPLTWGVFRPVVMLPEESSAWTAATRRLVLMHELAHVRRFDVAWVILGRLATALFWFHPLAWHAMRRLRDECEQASDDCVVAAGERPTDYAQTLLDLACSLRMPRWAVAVPMARSNLLEGRMMAMFDTNRGHGPLGRRSVGLLVGLATLAILGIATARPSVAKARAEVMISTDTLVPATTGQPVHAPEGTGRITGVAVRASDNQPIAGADVILLLPPPQGQNVYYGNLPLRKVVSDDKGAFAFEGLAPGRYMVWANSARLTSRRQHINRGGVPVVVSEKGDDTKPVELKLFAAPTVTVRVFDKTTGKPLPGAMVATGWSDFIDDFKADAQGVALVRPLTPERYRLDVWADGHARDSRWVNLESGLDADEIFTLAPGSNLEGRITDLKGQPIAGAGLSVRLKEGRGLQMEYVETGADGRYRVPNLPRDVMLTIDVSKDDYVRTNAEILLTTPAANADITISPMPDGGSIVGIVRDHQGRPVAGAELVNQGPSSNLVRETKTDANGRFRLDNLYQGSTGKDVLVRAKGLSPKRVKVEPGTREKPAKVTIDLEAGHSIKGRVVDVKGQPIAGVMVDYAEGRNPYSDGGRMNTDAQGRFAFDALPPDCPFGFSKARYSEIKDAFLKLDGDSEVVVTMTTAGVIEGRAVDARTGQPIKKFVVQITFSPDRLPGEPSGIMLTDLVDPGQSFQSLEGRFTLKEMIVGMPLQVTVLAEGYEKQVNGRVLVMPPADAAVVEFRLEPIDPARMRTIRGRIRNAQGQPVAGAEVRLIVAGPREGESRHAFPFNWQMITTGQIAQDRRISRFLVATTDAGGQFHFDRVPKDQELEIVWWGKNVVAGRLDHLEAVERQPDQPVEIAMKPASRVLGTIDRKLYPGDVRIGLSSESGEVTYDDFFVKPGQTEYEFPDLAPGTYSATLWSPYERVPGSSNGLTSRSLVNKQVTISPDRPGRVDFLEYFQE